MDKYVNYKKTTIIFILSTLFIEKNYKNHLNISPQKYKNSPQIGKIDANCSP
jgi:hypothetical protein